MSESTRSIDGSGERVVPSVSTMIYFLFGGAVAAIIGATPLNMSAT